MATVNQTPTMLLPCPGRDAVFATCSPSWSEVSELSCRISPLSTKPQAVHVTETQHGVSCTGWLAKERGEDVGRARAAALCGFVMGVQKQQTPLSEPSR